MGVFDTPLPPEHPTALMIHDVQLVGDADGWYAEVRVELEGPGPAAVNGRKVAIFYAGQHIGEGEADDWGFVAIKTHKLPLPSPRDKAIVLEARTLQPRLRARSDEMTVPLAAAPPPPPAPPSRPPEEAAKPMTEGERHLALRAELEANRDNLAGRNLRDLNLNIIKLSRANLQSACLDGTCLRLAQLLKADLSGASLLGADLRSANLTGANLSNADLTGADLTAANLSGANLSGAKLWGANLTGADLTGAILSEADRTYAKDHGANGL